MADQSEELKKLELISAARKIVNAEYIKRRSDEYNKWLLANKDAFKNANPAMPFSPPGTAFIPFQSSVVFPTEQDVVKKAVELYKLTNMNANVAPEVAQAEPEPVVDIIPEQTVITTPEILQEPEEKQPEELTDIQLRDALVAEIYKIYEDVVKTEPVLPEPVLPEAAPTIIEEPVVMDIVQELNVSPQPEEVVATVESNTGPMASVFQRIQELKNSWTKKNGGNL